MHLFRKKPVIIEAVQFESLTLLEGDVYNIQFDTTESLPKWLRDALIDWIHEAGKLQAKGKLAGVIVNAGAYTHTSIALMDAIKGAGVTLIELHISNVHAREAFRHHSYISPVAKAVMAGFGVNGYALAIAGLAQLAEGK